MNTKSILSTLFFSSVFAFNAEASLTLVDNGLGVYDNITNITWTSDGNLFSTMANNAIANGDSNAANLVKAIINASGGVINESPNIWDTTGTHTLSYGDFNVSGTTDFWGAQAFIHYLNTIDYGNSNQWSLPNVGANPQDGYNQITSQFGELFYKELGGTNGNNIPLNPLFSNEQTIQYWEATTPSDPIYSSSSGIQWYFGTGNGWLYEGGNQHVKNRYDGAYIWAVSPGQLGQSVAAVPVPGAVWLFASGLLGLLGLKRRDYAG